MKISVFFTSVPILKKSCFVYESKFLLKITSLLSGIPQKISGLPIVFDDGESVNFRLFFGVLLLFMLREYYIVQDM